MNKVHMGVWVYSRCKYKTLCQRDGAFAENRLVVRRDDEWPEVTCKMCIKKKPKQESGDE